MKLMFMFCNCCLNMALHSKNWLVDHKGCTCIFLEEALMTVTRTTFWSNGLITSREMSFAIEDSDEFMAGQQLRVNNGPGIQSVEIRDKRSRILKVVRAK